MGDEFMDNGQDKRRKLWGLVISILIPLAAGGLSALLTREGMELFRLMRKPPLAPPDWLFPVAWTVLYIMMGAASYLVFASGASRVRKNRALTFYAVQLGMNFFWPVIFFKLEMYLTAFVWLLGLWVLVLVCTLLFYHIDRRAGRLMIPYLLWITFAGYLNLGIYVLN